ncbi:MAG: hypothetical protein ACTHKL_03290, partial [Streptosporangiaceae bacterium]
SMDVEHIARAFPRPQDSRPVRSLTYQWDGRIYRAVIGGKRRPYDNAPDSAARRASRSSGPASGNLVLSIVATKAGIEIWSREPPRGWPNPSLVTLDAVVDIDYLDEPRGVAVAERDTEAEPVFRRDRHAARRRLTRLEPVFRRIVRVSRTRHTAAAGPARRTAQQ